ncbi:unnamed protein product [Caenorhabditis brenneri]
MQRKLKPTSEPSYPSLTTSRTPSIPTTRQFSSKEAPSKSIFSVESELSTPMDSFFRMVGSSN